MACAHPPPHLKIHKQDPVIVAFARTPIGKFQGGLAALSAPQLGAAVVKEAVARACKRVPPAVQPVC